MDGIFEIKYKQKNGRLQNISTLITQGVTDIVKFEKMIFNVGLTKIVQLSPQKLRLSPTHSQNLKYK